MFFALSLAAQGRLCVASVARRIKPWTVWLRAVDGVKLSSMDWLGACVALIGMGIIVMGWNAPNSY